jgi:DNA-binding NarL/FixJ family response regulator
LRARRTAAGCGSELLAQAARRPIDAAILDVRLPPALSDEGLRLADQLAASHPKVGILVLSQYAEPAYASRLFEHGSTPSSTSPATRTTAGACSPSSPGCAARRRARNPWAPA